jgi:hypothetical protein
MRFRPAKEVGKNRIKEASILLLARVPDSAERQNNVGGARVYPAEWTPKHRRFAEGFLDDPPKSTSRNTRRASVGGPAASWRGEPRFEGTELKRAESITARILPTVLEHQLNEAATHEEQGRIM